MKLNCKPGDLAVKIKGLPTDGIPVGAIVLCRKFFDGTAWVDGQLRTRSQRWLVTYAGSELNSRGEMWSAPDEFLRPIRDQDGEDETLTWAGKPEQVTV